MANQTRTQIRLNQLEERIAMLEQGLQPSRDTFRDRRLLVATVSEGLMILRDKDLISSELLATGYWDKHIINIIDAIPMHRRRLAVDVGAQFGFMSLALARRFTQVISFEPNDFSFALLSANFILNGLTNGSLFNHGLYSSNVHLSLGAQEQQEIELPLDENGRFDPLSTPNISSYCFTTSGTGSYMKEARTLDGFRLDNVDFVKIDVQGADGEVIFGSLETLRRCRPVLVFEWEYALSKAFSVDFAQLGHVLMIEGYILRPLYRHNEKQTDYLAFPTELCSCFDHIERID